MRRTLAMLAAALSLAAGPEAEAETRAVKPTWHQVRSGQVLGDIAKRYGLTVGELCRANRLRRSDVIMPGQKLRIPEHTGPISTANIGRQTSAKNQAVYRAPPGASWTPYVILAKRRGYVTIGGHGRIWSGFVLGSRNEILPRARARFAWVLASWRTGKQVPIDDRLIRLTARVSDIFGGRRIRIVSGYRERSHARNSRHKTGQALDFSIPGVPNDVLRDFLKTQPNTGVGYYPRSTHVHVDVRERNSYWVDYSRPGQRPMYGRAAPPPASGPRAHHDEDDDEGVDPAEPAESEHLPARAPSVARITR